MNNHEGLNREVFDGGDRQGVSGNAAVQIADSSVRSNGFDARDKRDARVGVVSRRVVTLRTISFELLVDIQDESVFDGGDS